MDELNHCMMGQLSYHAYLLMVFKATSPLWACIPAPPDCQTTDYN
jgi:hypothetical protein